MAAMILSIGFIGLIEGVVLATTMMEQARRQTLATQILDHEIEKLYLSDWTTITGLTTASTVITIDSLFDQPRLALGDTKSATAPVRFSMTRTITTPTSDTYLREVSFTVTWVVMSGRVVSGSQLIRTYNRSSSAWYGKYGLLLSYQRS